MSNTVELDHLKEYYARLIRLADILENWEPFETIDPDDEAVFWSTLFFLEQLIWKLKNEI